MLVCSAIFLTASTHLLGYEAVTLTDYSSPLRHVILQKHYKSKSKYQSDYNNIGLPCLNGYSKEAENLTDYAFALVYSKFQTQKFKYFLSESKVRLPKGWSLHWEDLLSIGLPHLVLRHFKDMASEKNILVCVFSFLHECRAWKCHPLAHLAVCIGGKFYHVSGLNIQVAQDGGWLKGSLLSDCRIRKVCTGSGQRQIICLTSIHAGYFGNFLGLLCDPQKIPSSSPWKSTDYHPGALRPT